MRLRVRAACSGDNPAANCSSTAAQAVVPVGQLSRHTRFAGQTQGPPLGLRRAVRDGLGRPARSRLTFDRPAAIAPQLPGWRKFHSPPTALWRESNSRDLNDHLLLSHDTTTEDDPKAMKAGTQA